MPYSIIKLPEQAVIMAEFVPPTEISDFYAVVQFLVDFSHQMKRPFFYIADASQMTDLTLELLIEGMNIMKQNLRGLGIHLAVVGSGELVEAGVGSLQTKYFGLASSQLFSSRDAALAYWAEKSTMLGQ